MFEFAISAEGLRKSYGDVHALRGIDLAVPAGTILGMLGPQRRREDDGRPHPHQRSSTRTAGRATVAGHDVVREPDAVRAAIGLSGQFAGRGREPYRPREPLEMVGRPAPRGPARRTHTAPTTASRPFRLVRCRRPPPPRT